MNAKKSRLTERLIALVEEAVAAYPVEYDGFQWVAYHQPDLAAELGVSVRTLRRLISGPPFQRAVKDVDGDGVNWSLLRVGAPPATKTNLHKTRIIAKLWRDKTGERVNRDQFGCIFGFVEDLPDGDEIEIFKAILNDWQGFKSIAQAQAWTGLYPGVTAIKFADDAPSLGFLRKFCKAGVELYGMKQQMGAVPTKPGKPLSETLAAVYMDE